MQLPDRDGMVGAVRLHRPQSVDSTDRAGYRAAAIIKVGAVIFLNMSVKSVVAIMRNDAARLLVSVASCMLRNQAVRLLST